MKRTKFNIEPLITEILLNPGDVLKLLTKNSSLGEPKTSDEPGSSFCSLRIEEQMSVVIERKSCVTNSHARVRVSKKDLYFSSKNYKSQKSLNKEQPTLTTKRTKLPNNSLPTLFPNEKFNLPHPGSNITITKSLFETFWRHYPKKASKGQAQTTWNKVCARLPKTERPTWRTLKLAIYRQMETELWKEKPQFIPNASTWLNQRRWLDDPKEMKVFRDSNERTKYKELDGMRYYLQPDGCYRNKAGAIWVD